MLLVYSSLPFGYGQAAERKQDWKLENDEKTRRILKKRRGEEINGSNGKVKNAIYRGL
jgi:hypothetical protein